MRTAYLLAIPLIALGAQSATPQPPAVVNVQLSSFKFTPKTIVLDRGRTYLLRLHNASKDGHDFTAPAFFAASTIAPEKSPYGHKRRSRGASRHDSPNSPDSAGRARALQAQMHPSLP